MAEPAEVLSDTARNALGYLGGGILALSLVPQIIRLLMTKSAVDISLMWSLLYFLGTTLSFLYLVLIGALAAWIPVVIEMCGCIITITLKVMYDHTDWGKKQQLLLEEELQQQDEMEAQRLVLDSGSYTALQLQQHPAGHHVDPAKVEHATVQQVQQAANLEEPQQQQLLRNESSHAEGLVAPEQQQPAVQHPPQQLQAGQAEGLPFPQQPRSALQHPLQERAATKKRVVINVPLTAAEVEAAAAAEHEAVDDGEVVLTVGVQLPGPIATKLGGPTLGPSAFNSLSTSAVTTPRSEGAPVVYEDNRSRRWQSGTSARKLPWYMASGISHNSVLKAPQSPSAAAACRCPTCGHRCLPPAEGQGKLAGSPSKRAWVNALFSPSSQNAAITTGGAPVTPHIAGSMLAGISRKFVRSVSRFGSGRGKSAAASQAATPTAMSPRPGGAGPESFAETVSRRLSFGAWPSMTQ